MMKLKPAALATLALLSTLAIGAQAQARKTYIVQLKAEPAVTYRGGIGGLVATAPQAGQPFRYGRPEVFAYTAYLEQSHASVAATVGNAPVLARYTNVFNGMALSLTEDEARQLVGNSQVAGIWEDEARQLDTISTAKFLKLSEAGGVWSQTVGGTAVKGENMVVGIIDGGIWPENPAFFDRVDANGKPSNNPADTQVYGAAPATFAGACVAGPGIDPAKHCNNKLIGIRHYNTGFNASGQTLHWTDFANSGRDSVSGATGHGGHGDHTASTAAGNANVPVIMNGASVGTAAGMAPRARIASYKVCWTYVNAAATDGTGSQNSCYNSDSVAAIDRAVADGVNVINYSISGSQTTVNDPVEQAFHRAALAGVFVAASAGNSGPGNAVAHISPWLTTVAASTHDRAFAGSVTLGNGATYAGGSTTQTGLPSTGMILAENAGMGGGDASLCFSASPPAGQVLLDPAKVAGKLVVCTRGTNARVDKGDAVKNAGGVGMILANAAAGQTIDADFQSVPTVQVSNTDGAAIKAYVGGASPTGSIAISTLTSKPAPLMAGFSSRGPNQGDSNILKPDLTAPGVDVIAQVTPGLTVAERDAVAAGTMVPPPAWASYQGTSMSSPHVAGLALLLKQAHPTWGPAAIKSALMTTAYSTLDDGVAGLSNGLLPWAQGSGHVDPQKANDPGLVYNSGKNDWIKYQCKVNRAAVSPASDCTTIGTFSDSYELNLPSITVGNVLASGVTVPRTVTNVGSSSATYTAAASVPGFTTVVTPASLTLNPGDSGSFTVKLTPTTAAEGVWNYGQLVWSDGSHSVRAPIQAKIGKPIIAPTEYTDTKAAGSKLFTVRTGFGGKMGVTKGGMKDVTMAAPVTLTPDADADVIALCLAGTDSAAVKVHNFTVPAGAIVARWALRDADVLPLASDHDLVVVGPANTVLGTSGGATSREQVQLAAPAAGAYKVCVQAYDGGAAATMNHSLSSWIVKTGDGAGLNAMVPSTVYAGGTATVGMSWSGLTTGKRYVGGIQLQDAGGVTQATTVLRVSTDGSVPVQNEPNPTYVKAKGAKLAAQ
jgi:Subtilase family/Fibronectin type-III domain/PA domain/Peptidase inhibitor I9